MTDNEATKTIIRLYDTINSVIFNDTLPQVIVKLENKTSDYLGSASFDIESVKKRLDEISEHGKTTTPLKHVLTIARDHILEDYLSTLIALTDTILHEAIHFDTMSDPGHGAAFMQSATAHGLEVITDSNGNYINTRIKADTALNILNRSNLIRKGNQ